MSVKNTLIALIGLPVILVFSQPEVTQTDLLKLVNGVGFWEGSNSITIDLQESGPDQVWDFSSIELKNATENENRMNLSENSPYGNLYPTADHVLVNILVSNPDYIVYSYLKVEDDRLEIISRVLDNAGKINYSHTHPDHYIPLPLTYGKTWQSVETDTMDWGDEGTYIYKVHYDNVVDAYGTVKLPAGTVECLRFRSDCMDVSNPDTVCYVEYTWVAKNNIYVAKAIGPYNNTNPDFTEASYFERFKSIQLPSGVSPRSAEIPSGYTLKNNYPNPFNPSTAIEYAIPNSEYVRLDIYNTSGQRIKTLQAGFQMAGQYKTTWNGTDESGSSVSTGIYIYRLKTQTTMQSKRMVLIQ